MILYKKTGTFVSNSTMDDTSKLKVDELKNKGGKFSKLSEKGYNVKGFYEVKVKGKCDMSNEDTKVCFDAPKGFKNGDKLRIRHLLSDGSVQTQDAKVRFGKKPITKKDTPVVETKKRGRPAKTVSVSDSSDSSGDVENVEESES